MSILSDQFTFLVAGATFFKGRADTVRLNNVLVPSAIISEVSYEDLVMHGGIGESGGFRFDTPISGCPAFAQFATATAYPHTYAAVSLLGKNGVGADTPRILITALRAGVYGNQIRVNLATPAAPSQALSVVCRGRVIDISVATNGASVVTTTPTQLRTALLANAQAALLVTPTIIGDGLGLMSIPINYTLNAGSGFSGQVLDFKSTNDTVYSIVVGDPVTKR